MNLEKVINNIFLALVCIFIFLDIILKRPFSLFLDVAWFFFCLYLLKKDGE